MASHREAIESVLAKVKGTKLASVCARQYLRGLLDWSYPEDENDWKNWVHEDGDNVDIEIYWEGYIFGENLHFCSEDVFGGNCEIKQETVVEGETMSSTIQVVAPYLQFRKV